MYCFGSFFMPSKNKWLRCAYFGNYMIFALGICKYVPEYDSYRCLWGYR